MERSQPTFINCTFDAQGGNYAFSTSAPRYVNVTNTTIVDNNVVCDLSLYTAYFTMTNSSFNKSKVIFSDAKLTTRNYLNTLVTSSGTPISGKIWERVIWGLLYMEILLLLMKKLDSMKKPTRRLRKEDKLLGIYFQIGKLTGSCLKD